MRHFLILASLVFVGSVWAEDFNFNSPRAKAAMEITAQGNGVSLDDIGAKVIGKNLQDVRIILGKPDAIGITSFHYKNLQCYDPRSGDKYQGVVVWFKGYPPAAYKVTGWRHRSLICISDR